MIRDLRQRCQRCFTRRISPRDDDLSQVTTGEILPVTIYAMRRRVSQFVVWFSLLTVAHAQISEAERADIEHQLKESVAVIVGLYSGKHLRYESSGHLLSRAKVGYWTLDGLIKVDAVQLDKHALRIRGSRVEVSFPEHDQHRVLQTRGRRVEIDAELPLNADRAALTALIGHILTF